VTFDEERFSVQKFDGKSLDEERRSGMVVRGQRRDAIGRFVEEAVQILPTLDPEVEAALDRMHKITEYLDRTTQRTVKVFGLNTGAFKVLLNLREAPDQAMAVGALAERMDLSSTAMTNRLDRLGEDGLVSRERGMEDRRSVLVTITSKGEDITGQTAENQRKVRVPLAPERLRVRTPGRRTSAGARQRSMCRAGCHPSCDREGRTTPSFALCRPDPPTTTADDVLSFRRLASG
jgi:DNA-binding MarR family transcriptional regulator